MWVLRISRGERWSLRQDDEEDDGRGEEVNAGALVLLSEVDLGSHVARGTELGLKQARVVTSGDGSGESQICDLKHVVAVKEQILGLEVTMSIALLVHEAEPIKELLEVVASSCL